MIAAGVFLYAFIDNAAVAVGDVLGQGKTAPHRARAALRFLPAIIGIGFLIWYFTQCSYVTYTNGIWHIHETVPAKGSNGRKYVFIPLRLCRRVQLFAVFGAIIFPFCPLRRSSLVGGAIGRLIYHSSAKYALSPLDGAWNSGVCFIGRHAAFVYVAHMVVIPVALFLSAWVASLF